MLDREYTPAEHELDLMLGPEGVGPQVEALRLPLPCEELLRERRPLVGRHRFVPDDDDPPVEALGPQGLGAAAAREAGSDDQDGAWSHHAAFRSAIVIAAIGQAAAASRTAGSSDSPARIDAVPPASTSKISGASSAQAPKPLRSRCR
jgi:hypothetical protein